MRLQLNKPLNKLVGLNAIVRARNPIRLNGYSEPEPDVALVKPRNDFYSREHPGPGDVLLLIEVADTSVERDLEVKLPLYARVGIPEAWFVDLPVETIPVSPPQASTNSGRGSLFIIARYSAHRSQ